MLENVALNQKLSVSFDPRFPIEGEVVGVERDDQDRVEALLLRANHVEGTLYLTAEELAVAAISFPGQPHLLN